MIRSNITVARIPPVMTTVPAVIRMALHQHPAKEEEEEEEEQNKEGEGKEEKGADFISPAASLSRL